MFETLKLFGHFAYMFTMAIAAVVVVVVVVCVCVFLYSSSMIQICSLVHFAFVSSYPLLCLNYFDMAWLYRRFQLDRLFFLHLVACKLTFQHIHNQILVLFIHYTNRTQTNS